MDVLAREPVVGHLVQLRAAHIESTVGNHTGS
jgi:hypothetical protein